ncbi:MAG: hypothetical protein JRE92_07300 [Deltaproteobacteria bacterium]|jgi:hypothetical protein|nr:hypothetical protein [Deltaproteobacteria bacterium]
MKKLTTPILIGSLILTIALLINFVGLDIANACGWGQGGGQGYVPQRRDSNGFLAQKQALTEEQARDIVTKYVKRLNPNLEVGNLKDNGSFYEAEIIAEDNEVIQLVGIDKRSGRLIVLN